MAVPEMAPSPSPWGTQEGPARVCSLWVVGWCPCRGVGARDLVPVHAGVRCKHVCAVQRDACGEPHASATQERWSGYQCFVFIFNQDISPVFL